MQKYEKGVNRISASRLQHISHILRVPIPFFFEGLPSPSPGSKKNPAAPFPTYVSDFVATSEGLSLIKAIYGYQEVNSPALYRSPGRGDGRRRLTHPRLASHAARIAMVHLTETALCC